MKWEYSASVCEANRFIAELNRFGEEGWEVWDSFEHEDGHVTFYLKRPKQ